jgi:peptidoglycan hydrolase FlgJ
MTMIDATALIGRAQDAYSIGVQGQIAKAARGPQGPANAGGLDEKSARTTAESFESFFVGQMLEYMTEGLKPDPEFGGGHAEEMWRSMMNQEYGKHIVKSGGLGIAKDVMTSMLRAQEERTTANQKLSAMGMLSEPTGDAAAADVNTAGALSAAAQLRR